MDETQTDDAVLGIAFHLRLKGREYSVGYTTEHTEETGFTVSLEEIVNAEDRVPVPIAACIQDLAAAQQLVALADTIGGGLEHMLNAIMDNS